ncbi:addiction module antidote protein, HigA family [Novosphingobium sp. FGD1]|uniref:Addiction module antidote protein, HigA family n=1 Tax=Novosphingobium silvae TaxID=2692619 RepID=A0A7X4GFC1_9SPHN|nr:addiction module antidote protein, HigA family [Novosphingobium silvae]MYL97219.1 addiction module antidote protein, HigA family [Novosphingobium silvae]
MPKRDNSEYKITDPADMIVDKEPPIEKHPGEFIRDVILPEYGLNVAKTARLLGIDRAGLHGVLTGRYAVSRELAYKFGALLRDDLADFLIAYQHAYDLFQEQDLRESFKDKIERLAAPEGPS